MQRLAACQANTDYAGIQLADCDGYAYPANNLSLTQSDYTDWVSNLTATATLPLGLTNSEALLGSVNSSFDWFVSIDCSTRGTCNQFYAVSAGALRAWGHGLATKPLPVAAPCLCQQEHAAISQVTSLPLQAHSLQRRVYKRFCFVLTK
jgi:hypothetical protein